MEIIQLPVGPLGTNCYIVISKEEHVAMVIDPGGNGGDILRILREKNAVLTYIVNTHGHADHIAANGILAEATGASVLIHEADAAMLTSPHRNLSTFIGDAVILKPADSFLKAGDVLTLGALSFTILETPGHTPGSISLFSERDEVLISGDTVFTDGSFGRYDFKGGSKEALSRSLARLSLLDVEGLYPGHGAPVDSGGSRHIEAARRLMESGYA